MLFISLLNQLKSLYSSLVLSIKLNLSYTVKHLLQLVQKAHPFKSTQINKKLTFKSSYVWRDFMFTWDKYSTKFNKGDSTSVIDSSSSKSMIISQNVEPTQFTNFKPVSPTLSNFLFLKSFVNSLSIIAQKSFGFSFFYIQGFIFVLFIDACLTDDEPLWEPIEWSLVQTWILFIFTFAWIAENLIVSRYGSYTGRDKRVWMSWYKTFWLIEGYYIINYGVAAVFVIIPFYFETNYNLSFVYSWWHWYSRVFFFKFLSILTLVMFIAHYLQITVRWLNFKKGLFLVILVNIFLSYLIYTQFIITFLGFFTDPVWYQKTRPIDYIQLSHEPARWGWGSAKKDHFTYHGVKTVFWFKNDGPFAAAMIFFQTFLFICIFFLYIYWITLFRRIWSMQEIPLTLTTYCVSSLRQFFYFALFMYVLVFVSYMANYSRLPIEFLWSLDNISWLNNYFLIISDYPTFLKSIFLS